MPAVAATGAPGPELSASAERRVDPRAEGRPGEPRGVGHRGSAHDLLGDPEGEERAGSTGRCSRSAGEGAAVGLLRGIQRGPSLPGQGRKGRGGLAVGGSRESKVGGRGVGIEGASGQQREALLPEAPPQRRLSLAAPGGEKPRAKAWSSSGATLRTAPAVAEHRDRGRGSFPAHGSPHRLELSEGQAEGQRAAGQGESLGLGHTAGLAGHPLREAAGRGLSRGSTRAALPPDLPAASRRPRTEQSRRGDDGRAEGPDLVGPRLGCASQSARGRGTLVVRAAPGAPGRRAWHRRARAAQG